VSAFGLLDEWISHIKINTGEILKSDSSFNEKFKMAVELNVLASVRNLSCVPLIQQVWNNSQRLDIHGWVYDIKDGKLTDLGFDVGSMMDLDGLGADRKY
jgi:carbonic anhydrase